MRIAVVVGTRPEAIKLAPVTQLLGREALVVHTGQHFSAGMSGQLTQDIVLDAHDDHAPALTRRAASLSATVPVSGPSGLSDYAVSLLGMPTALLADEVRVAFLGRTSTEASRTHVNRWCGSWGTARPRSPSRG